MVLLLTRTQPLTEFACKYYPFFFIVQMLELEATLVARLKDHEEKLSKHRSIVDKQRQWLLSKAPSEALISHEPEVPGLKRQENAPSFQRVEDRLLAHGEENKKRLESERQRALQERLEVEKAAVERDVSKRRVASGVASKEYAQHRERTLLQQPADVSGKPQISLESERLAAEKRLRENLDGVDIAESLLIRGEQSKENAWKRLQDAANAIPKPVPCITNKARHLEMNQDVVSRLYATENNSAESLRDLISRSLEIGKPTVSKRAKELQRKPGHVVYDDLYSDARRLSEARSRIFEERAKTPPPSATPRINAVSDYIASQLPQTSTERLTTPRTAQLINDKPSFKPRISKESERLAQIRKQEEHDIFSALHSDGSRRSAHIQQLAMKSELEAVSQCTFRPSISAKAKTKTAEKLEHRVSQWAQKRQQRLDETAVEHLEQVMSECTFHPKVNSAPMNEMEPTPAYDGEGSAWGYHRFVDRYSGARQRKELERSAQEAVFSSGAKWQNVATTPKAPNLSCFSPRSHVNSSVKYDAIRSAMDALRAADDASQL